MVFATATARAIAILFVVQAAGPLSVVYVKTKDQVADALTKPLHGPKLAWTRTQLGLVPLPITRMGGVNT
jgi:hypothetical protein